MDSTGQRLLTRCRCPLPVARCPRLTTLTTLPFRLPLPATELRILPDVARESRVAAAVLDGGDESLYLRIIESAEHARKVPLIDAARRIEFHKDEIGQRDHAQAGRIFRPP